MRGVCSGSSRRAGSASVESDLLEFEEGAAAFAIASGVPVVPCAVVGTTHLWFRRRLSVRFGPPIVPAGARGREARSELERRTHAAVHALLPPTEPRLPTRQPLAFLTDLLNGRDDIERRATEDPLPSLIMEAIRSVLRLAHCRRIEAGWLASLAGEMAGTIALLVYAYAEGGAGLVAVYGVVRTLPAMIVTPAIVGLTDRLAPERVLR